MADQKQQTKTTTKRHTVKVVAFALLGVLLGALWMVAYQSMTAPVLVTTPVVEESPIQNASVAEPARLRIPAVGIDTTFEGSLGLNADRTIQVPQSYQALGWYEYAPLPGERGPAVVLGHVDSYRGPAVFWPLKNTKKGDRIEIERVDGSVAVFEITEHLTRQQSDFPTEAVYGDIDHAGLRLITCSGTFDRGKQVYSHNLIVFAKLVEERPAHQ